MFTLATFAILATMVLALFRALKGPTVFDRVLAVNSFTTKTTLLIVVVQFLTGRPEFLDLALLYALLNLVGTVTFLKFFATGDLATRDAARDKS